MEARAARVARAVGPATGNRVEPPIAEASTEIQELIEEGDIGSGTEEDAAALGSGYPDLAFSGRPLPTRFLSMDLKC